MPLFIAKPIMWNTRGYRRPAGVRINSGYPRDHGFGHEEWNNSAALRFRENGVAMRAFHTERVGNAPVDEEAGDIFIFMYASHDGVQELVGVAGGATSLIENEPRRQRLAATRSGSTLPVATSRVFLASSTPFRAATTLRSATP